MDVKGYLKPGALPLRHLAARCKYGSLIIYINPTNGRKTIGLVQGGVGATIRLDGRYELKVYWYRIGGIFQ